jgi:hypothetical protein
MNSKKLKEAMKSGTEFVFATSSDNKTIQSPYGTLNVVVHILEHSFEGDRVCYIYTKLRSENWELEEFEPPFNYIIDKCKFKEKIEATIEDVTDNYILVRWNDWTGKPRHHTFEIAKCWALIETQSEYWHRGRMVPSKWQLIPHGTCFQSLRQQLAGAEQHRDYLQQELEKMEEKLKTLEAGGEQ